SCRTCGRGTESAASRFVGPGCLGVVDARGNTAGRSAADSGKRTRGSGRRGTGVIGRGPGAGADAAVRPAVTAAGGAHRQPQSRIGEAMSSTRTTFAGAAAA